MAGALPRQREGQRTHIRGFEVYRRANGARHRQGLAAQPFGVIDAVGHFALPQRWQQSRDAFLCNPVDHAPATASGQESEDQARTLGRATVQAAPHFQRAVVAANAGKSLLVELEFGPPDQRCVAEDPQVAFAAPLAQNRVKHARRIAAGLGSVWFERGWRRHLTTLAWPASGLAGCAQLRITLTLRRDTSGLGHCCNRVTTLAFRHLQAVNILERSYSPRPGVGTAHCRTGGASAGAAPSLANKLIGFVSYCF